MNIGMIIGGVIMILGFVQQTLEKKEHDKYITDEIKKEVTKQLKNKE